MNTSTKEVKAVSVGLGDRITVSQLETLIAEGKPVQLLDVRTAREYSDVHIPGAFNVPMDELPSRMADIRSDIPAILICQSGRRADLCRKTVGAQATVLEGGTKAWQDQGRPVVGGRTHGLPIMRQVQLAAGLMILTGVALSAVNPYWIGLTAFVGVGMTVAGVTGFCGMANLLAAMPWNRTSK